MRAKPPLTGPAQRPSGWLKLKYFVPSFLFLYLLALWVMNMNVNDNNNNSQQKSQLIDTSAFIPTSQKNFKPVNKKDSVRSKVIQSTDPNFPREPKPRPPLDSIVQGWNITGDPSWLLNLAIIGFPKTGTSTLMHYLHMSSQVHVFDEERCEMGYNQHVKLIESLYNDIPPGDVIRGIKCPRDLEIPFALKNYETYFHETDFMVGVRHPVEWFESFYNFRVHNLFPMPPPDMLLGRCTRRHQGLCTFRGNFHLFLANLGKTNIANNTHEQELIPEQYRTAIKPKQLKGRVFMWDISQLKNTGQNNTTTDGDNGPYRHSNFQFRKDLQHFLRLEEPLPEMIWVKPGYAHQNSTILDHIDSKKIDICDFKYFKLRDILLKQGKLAAQWIRDYFLEAEGVFVSQKEYFVNVVLKSWEQDPCINRKVITKKK